jgi:hypothetical protein
MELSHLCSPRLDHLEVLQVLGGHPWPLVTMHALCAMLYTMHHDILIEHDPDWDKGQTSDRARRLLRYGLPIRTILLQGYEWKRLHVKVGYHGPEDDPSLVVNLEDISKEVVGDYNIDCLAEAQSLAVIS